MLQDLTAAPFMCTVQAPHWRGIAADVGAGQAQVVRGSSRPGACAAPTSAVTGLPFTVMDTLTEHGSSLGFFWLCALGTACARWLRAAPRMHRGSQGCYASAGGAINADAGPQEVTRRAPRSPSRR